MTTIANSLIKEFIVELHTSISEHKIKSLSTIMRHLKAVNTLSVDQLISSIQSSYEIGGPVPSDSDKPEYSRSTLWLVALEAIEYAVTAVAEHYEGLHPIIPPDCEHDDYSDIADDNDYGYDNIA